VGARTGVVFRKRIGSATAGAQSTMGCINRKEGFLGWLQINMAFPRKEHFRSEVDS